MSKSILSAAALAGLALGLAALPATGNAQAGKVSEIIVYGTDPCPRSTDDEVVVCARKPESERYRIPEALRQGGSLQSRTAWAERARQFETYGRTGTNTCSPVGPGGANGCAQQLINQACRERADASRSDNPQ
jgi:hypothetical protein